MDCNRDEALRAKEVAEQKFYLKDYLGAKKFALKALNIFPALEGMDQMLVTLNVYLAGEVKIKGESDWYSILGVDAMADEETVRKQYRKLALQLHPDKNKTVGAEGAFKFISEAWSVLSDTTRKMVYDQKRNMKISRQRKKRDHPGSNSATGFFDFANNTSNVKMRKTTSAASRTAAARSSQPNTFWTSCDKCRMQYEYLRVYLNQNLLCPNCHEAFLALETIVRSNVPPSVSRSVLQQDQQKSNNDSPRINGFDHGKVNSTVQEMGNMTYQQVVNPDSDNNPDLQWGAFSRTAGDASAAASSAATAQAAQVDHQMHEKVKREHEETQAISGKVVRRRKRASKKKAEASGYPDASISGIVPGHEQPVPQMGNMTYQQVVNPDPDNNPDLQWGAFSRTAGDASAAASSSATTQAAQVDHQMHEKVKREHEETQATSGKAVRRRKRASKKKAEGSGYPDASISGIVPGHEQPVPQVDRPRKRSKGTRDKTVISFGGNDTEAPGNTAPSAEQSANSNKLKAESSKTRNIAGQNNISRVFSEIDIRKMLTEKAKVSISKKLKEWNSAEVAKLEEKEKAKQKEKEKAKQKEKHKDGDNGKTAAEVDGVDIKLVRFDDLRNNGKETSVKNGSAKNPDDSAKLVIQPVTIDVPDPDFHDFDKDRSERSFEGEQVWATYDNEDGMPRFYALVQKVISLRPFKIRMSFLNSKSNSEWGPLNWVASGFAKTCGDFRISKYEICDTINIFSHRVEGEKGTRGAVKIVPRKGDTWALYRNWSPNWNMHTTDDVIHKYDMVEVLDDYNEEQGVSVTPLVKVAGFKTVFHRHLDPNEVKRIPREEMFRFSHQVPSHLLTGDEGHNAPVGCRELDPAATPLDLLKVITEVNEDNVMETAEQLG